MNFEIRFHDEKYPGLYVSALIHSVSEYVTTIKEYLPLIQDQNKVRFKARIKSQNKNLSDADCIEEQEIHEFINQGLIPSKLNGSALVAIWSAFETSINALCEYIHSRSHSKLKIQALRDNNLKSKIELYISVVTKKEIFLDNKLNDLYFIRNIFAHQSGETDKLNSDLSARFHKIKDTYPGIKVSDNAIVLSASFLEDSLTLIRDSLQVILDVIHELYPEVTIPTSH